MAPDAGRARRRSGDRGGGPPVRAGHPAASGARRAATGALTTAVDESIGGLATVRSFGCAEPLLDTAEERGAALFEANRRADLYAALLQPSLALLTGLITAVLVVAGGWMVDEAVLTASAWYLFVLATDRVAWLLASTGALDGQAQTALAAAQRAFELIDSPEPPTPPAETHARRADRARSGSTISG
ncbi:hypothetical protein NKG94_02520 [Micromonospora sp. M12]